MYEVRRMMYDVKKAEGLTYPSVGQRPTRGAPQPGGGVGANLRVRPLRRQGASRTLEQPPLT